MIREVTEQVRKDGQRLDVALAVSPIKSSDGELVGTSTIVRDITDQRRYQHHIEMQNQELELRNREVERANQMKSLFLASMSHELRTPLNAILGFSSLLAEQGRGSLNEKQERYVAHIRSGGEHLLQLINDILDLSKIEAGKLELHAENFAVDGLLPEVLSVLRPLALAKQIRLESHVDPGSAVYADPIRFKQVLYNLLSNAIKFTPKGKRSGSPSTPLKWHGVLLGPRHRDRNPAGRDGKRLQGISSGRNDDKGRKGRNRTGPCDRAPSRGAARGYDRRRKHLGEGSCFHFTLPEAEAILAGSTLPKAHQKPAAPKERKPLVLVVDDELGSRELLSSYLEPEGYQIATAPSGEEALRAAEELRPDVITLDMLMPGKGGWLTLSELKSKPATASIPIIIVSVVDHENLGFALGASEYLVKPVARDPLLQAIARHAAPRRDLNSEILVIDDEPRDLQLIGEILESAGYSYHTAAGGGKHSSICNKAAASGYPGFADARGGFIRSNQPNEKKPGSAGKFPSSSSQGKDLTDADHELLNRETRVLFRKGERWKEEMLAHVRSAVSAPLTT